MCPQRVLPGEPRGPVRSRPTMSQDDTTDAGRTAAPDQPSRRRDETPPGGSRVRAPVIGRAMTILGGLIALIGGLLIVGGLLIALARLLYAYEPLIAVGLAILVGGAILLGAGEFVRTSVGSDGADRGVEP